MRQTTADERALARLIASARALFAQAPATSPLTPAQACAQVAQTGDAFVAATWAYIQQHPDELVPVLAAVAQESRALS